MIWIALALTGCSGGSTTDDTGDLERSQCDLYLACVEDVEASLLAGSVALYGPEGSCWADEATAEVCDATCGGLVEDLGLLHPTAQTCFTEAQIAAACPFEDGVTWYSERTVQASSGCDDGLDGDRDVQLWCESIPERIFRLDDGLDVDNTMEMTCIIDSDGSTVGCDGTDYSEISFAGTVEPDFSAITGTQAYDAFSCDYTFDYSATPL